MNIPYSTLEGVGFTLDTEGDPGRIVRLQVEAWTAELSLLRRDPSVRKFLELQDRIEQTGPPLVGIAAPPWDWPWPYDLYDAFEFARDLAGRQVSTRALSGLEEARFPDMSTVDREILIRFLLENGAAVVARTTDTGRPASYCFAPLRSRSASRNGKGLGLPSHELSGLKAEDLEDVTCP